MGRNGRLNKSDGRLTHENSSKNGTYHNNNSSSSRKAGSKTKLVKQNLNLVTTASTNNKDSSSHELLDSVTKLQLQQTLLNIFKVAFASSLAADNLPEILHKIKDALFERDFNRAFGSPQYLETYAARWSPSRALCYHSLLIDLNTNLMAIDEGIVLPNSGHDEHSLSPLTFCKAKGSSLLQKFGEVVCFGGGAAEVVAFAGFLRYLKNDPCLQKIGHSQDKFDPLTIERNPIMLDARYSIRLIDCAQWQDVIHKLNDVLTSFPMTSMDKETTKTETSSLFLNSSDIDISYVQEDILSMSLKKLINLTNEKQTFVTIFFTLNELCSSSVSKTTAFLLNLTLALKSGSILLVVDSPGSYSETSIGSCNKKYPIFWLLDFILLNESTRISKDSSANWIKLITEKSKWFRLSDSLKYAIPLENMRYQIHLYQRL
ncbi:25S rRNA -methyltransferase [Erysiphe neolycopersici]|uniref:25S rRNA-methyltransferase n=1 Tax=Erysiphe neolycopersici TaxID=212602 RepID=A0A420HTP2_9PEZI|nr:25S rRNA -methyltransferase [Erysiphe neolycopersici]